MVIENGTISHSIVTMAMISEIKRDIGRNHDFFILFAFVATLP